MYYYSDYVSVAKQRLNAERQIRLLRAQKSDLCPIDAFRGKIASSFWGRSWCDNLEAYADYDYRLDRGRRYVRAGCVCHLSIAEGNVEALVNGTDLYRVSVRISPLDKDQWKKLCARCSGQVGSLLELMKGRISKEVMEIVSATESGLFPSPREIRFSCSCPDAASMCKHVAAALYGVGRRLDRNPELLFLLRGVDPADLLLPALDMTRSQPDGALDEHLLESLFDIDLDMGDVPVAEPVAAPSGAAFPPAPVPAPPSSSSNADAEAMDKDNGQAFDPLHPTGSGIRALRALAGLSQAEFARRLGVSTASVVRWEANGELSLHQSSIAKLHSLQNKLMRSIKRRSSKR